MTDSSPHGTQPAALIAFPGPDGEPVGLGAIARVLASPDTNEYVRKWLGAAIGRDPQLAYQEAATLAGILELLTCEEARAWLLPAITAALNEGPEVAFAAAVEMATVLKPAAMVLEEHDMVLPEPANSRG